MLLHDAGSPEALVAEVYEIISGPADQERDWGRFRDLFQPDARIMAFTTLPDGSPQEGVWTVEEFVAAASTFYAEDGFWEREIWSRTERFGSVAHVFSTYESRVGSRDSPPVGRGINSVQMVRHDGRWWIAGIAFELEGPDRPIPGEYGGSSRS